MLKKMAATNEPRSKRSRTTVRYQMNLSFSTDEAKEDFITSLEKVKKILSRRSLRQLDNLELLQKLFDMVSEDEDSVDSERENDGHRQPIRPMLENSGMECILLYVCVIH